MTHEELLAKINDYSCCSGAHELALRAVVELHIPSPEGRYDNLICAECSFTETSHYVFYPCRNIQAIEKALN